jgi:glycosyltransferase involved in cell wall biosynthesis
MSFVSVVIPCYNEEKHIQNVLNAIISQEFPKDKLEILVVDGGSTDKTQILLREWANQNPFINFRILNNTNKNIPSALNIGIRESKGGIIVRMDAHSIPEKDYLALCIKHLDQGLADNVGGRWIIIPGSDTWISHAIAQAAAHPLGVGDAKYRYSDQAEFVDTVPFGAFNKEIFTKIGLFDETLLTNEDYEVNTRIRKAGGKIYFDPLIKTKYVARSTLSELSKQYWRYGFWKFKMLKKYPDTIRWRQALPPMMVIGTLSLLFLSIFLSIAWIGLLSLLGIYFIVLMLGALSVVKKTKKLSLLIGIPLAIIVMHFSWGAGFLCSPLKQS